jgi:pimeloyl-ACP methyl ester carboxylesterase
VEKGFKHREGLQKLDPREEHFFVPGPKDGLKLFLRSLLPSPLARNAPIVLYVHGMSFPSGLSIAHRFDGRSWRDELCDAGFEVWGLDFYGFGFSDRYVEMGQPADLNPPLGRVDETSFQIEHAARFICERRNRPRISIIAHSGGAIATGLFACRNPELLDRLVFFAPIVRRRPGGPNARRFPAWRLISLKDQWDRFTEDVPNNQPPVLLQDQFREWGERYLKTDSEGHTRSPASVKVPCGLIQDVVDAWHGFAAYDPAGICAPVAIIRGEWDTWSNETDARSLFEELRQPPVKRLVTISRATHLMHLEESRYALYRESIAFLQGLDHVSAIQPSPIQIQAEQGKGEAPMNATQRAPELPGYTYGTDQVAKSPITLEEWEQLKKSALFSEEDVFYLRLSHDVLADQIDDLLKVWRGIIFDHPHLRAYDENPKTGEVDADYAKAVGKRFGQWVLDTAKAQYDQTWLDYQYEIGLRHHRTKKNKTDHGHTAEHIRARDLIAFSASIVVPMKPFLARKGHHEEVVNRMYDAWWKSMILQVTLWSQPYIREGDF